MGRHLSTLGKDYVPKRYRRHNVSVRGEIYESIAKAAKERGISATALVEMAVAMAGLQ